MQFEHVFLSLLMQNVWYSLLTLYMYVSMIEFIEQKQFW